MSIQWSFIAGYLYFEIAIVTVMILPIFSPRKWHTFFRSRLFAMFQQQAAVYFYVLLGVLALFLMDAVKEMRKYSHTTDHVHLTNEMKGNVKLFRAQRNFYITGFAIFLAFVIRRLVTMLIIQHELELKAQEIIMKAEDTVQMAKSTVIEHRIEDASDIAVLTHKFTLTKALLDEQKLRVQELEEEATMWRLKYEDMQGHKNGQGDE